MDFPEVFATHNLVLAGVPVGNVGDASPRLCQALEQAEIIACEDTRKLRDLLRRLGAQTHARLVAYHEHNEAHLSQSLVEAAQSGQHVVMVSDAGMPGISDPGYRLVCAAAAAGVDFTVIPGPSAPLLALVHSALPTDSFSFWGFLPRKAHAMEQALEKLRHLPQTQVFFESPRRVLDTLKMMTGVFGENRRAALVRELTKTYEQTLRGTLGEIFETLENGPEVRGEIVIVVEGENWAPNHGETDTPEEVPPELLEKLEQLVQFGLRAKDAAKLLAQWFGASPKVLYEAHLRGH